MIKIRQKLFVLLILLVPMVLLAQPITDKSLKKLIVLSGLSKQLAEYPDLIWIGFEQAREQSDTISDADSLKIHRSIDDAFDSTKVLNIVSSKLKSSMLESEATSLLTWYNSDLGRAITDAENRASTAKAYQDMMSNATSLLADKERVELAEKIDDLVKSTDFSMELQNSSTIAIFIAMSTATNPDQSVNIDALKEQLSAHQDQMRAEVHQLVTLSLVYAYRNLEIDNIKEYTQFLQRPDAKKFYKRSLSGIHDAFNHSSTKLGTSLAHILSKK